MQCRQRIARIERRLAAQTVIRLGQRRGRACKPARKNGLYRFATGDFVQLFQQLRYFTIAAGKNIALPGASALTAGENSVRHIANIAEIVAAADACRQPSACLLYTSIPKDAQLLVYCRSGRRSAEAAQKLLALGYEHVYDFGGIIDWPFETESGAPQK